MQVSIYKSSKKDEMYLYVARPADENEAETFEPLEVLAEPVRVAFGRATFVMHLELINPNAPAPEGLRGA